MKWARTEIIVVGGVSTDFLVHGSRLSSEGGWGRRFIESPGGKGANQALACARLGGSVTLIARVGSDSRGEQAVCRLEAEGVNTRFVVRDERAETGATLLMVDGKGGRQSVFSPEANHRLRPSDIRKAVQAFRRASVVLIQLEIPLGSTLAAAALAVGCGARVILDPAPAPLFRVPDTLFRLTDLVKPNRLEAERLTGARVTDRSSARIAGEALLWRGASAALVEADEGSLLLCDERERWFPHLPLTGIDTTGAGDALAAGIAVRWSEGEGLASAVSFGNAAAALATLKFGAQPSLPSRQAVLSLLKRDFPSEFRSTG